MYHFDVFYILPVVVMWIYGMWNKWINEWMNEKDSHLFIRIYVRQYMDVVLFLELVFK
jgi:hypothetical protein